MLGAYTLNSDVHRVLYKVFVCFAQLYSAQLWSLLSKSVKLFVKLLS